MPGSGGEFPKRGDIWLVELDPTRGDEMRKTRPVVVISSDAFSGLDLKVCVPVTGWKDEFDRYDWFAKLVPGKINNLTKTSAANGLQVRCLSTERFQSRTGRVSKEELEDILASVAIVLEML
ncbi:MAG: type II toxin-antitoxin system PemK/MazF family toxin [Thermovirgaceae bacterium]|nr:type II toxin-antitoxin system PemK/MazF family toxin [Thermovirgaceae bacterium]